MRKLTFCICENKDADQFCSYCSSAPLLVQFLYFLKTNFPAPAIFLACIARFASKTVRKSHCWFSHYVAQFILKHNILSRSWKYRALEYELQSIRRCMVIKPYHFSHEQVTVISTDELSPPSNRPSLAFIFLN